MAKSVNVNQFMREIGVQFTKEVPNAVIRGLQSAAMRGVSRVVEAIDDTQPHAPVDTGGMRQSVSWAPLPNGAELFVDSPHAGALEDGARPHFPPIEPLAQWALRKGLADDDEEAKGIAFAIAQSIAKNGMAPRHFFRRGMRVLVTTDLRREIEQELRSL